MEVLQNLKVDDFLTSDEQKQAPYVAAAFGGMVLSHVLLNALAVKAPKCSQFIEKGTHYVALAAIVLLNMEIDTRYPDVKFAWWSLKGLLGGYGIGIIDFFFSDLTYVPVIDTIKGLSVWVITYWFTGLALTEWYGMESFPVNTTADLYDWTFLPWSYARLFMTMMVSGFTNDIFFNPLHRIQHLRSGYKHDHKHHHQYTDDLCGLAFYSGTFIDDLIMSNSVATGFIIHLFLFNKMGLLSGYISSSMYYFAWGLVTYAHSHNENLSTMVLPIPEDKNFVTYHRMHHIDPSCNMGFTEPGDRFFDWVFGQTTISKSKAVKKE